MSGTEVIFKVLATLFAVALAIWSWAACFNGMRATDLQTAIWADFAVSVIFAVLWGGFIIGGIWI